MGKKRTESKAQQYVIQVAQGFLAGVYNSEAMLSKGTDGAYRFHSQELAEKVAVKFNGIVVAA